ncbi:class I SAM-dependent methyltransferase [Planctomycetaceae bacterium SH139]
MKLSNWYDYPQYFDMVFRDETAYEVDFFEAAFTKYASGPVRRLYEPGCGSGRLVVAMAALGYEVCGLDLSKPSLSYLRRKLRRRGLTAELVEGDMLEYQPTETIDAAFCTFNTFRHLLSQEAALTHLRSVARSLRPGGIYILGFHIIPLDADEDCIERWRAKHGKTAVTTTLQVVDFNRDERRERLRVTLTAKTEAKTIRCRTEFPLRLYTHQQVEQLFQQLPEYELVGIHDFDYAIDESRELDDDLTDAVFVLRKR